LSTFILSANCFNWFQAGKNDSGGGTACAGCTVIVQISRNYAVYNDKSVADVIEKEICKFFPTPLYVYCKEFMEKFGPTIIDLIA